MSDDAQGYRLVASEFARLAAVALAGMLDDRAAPYTLPMKAVPQQCGALGRVRPATAPTAKSGGAHGLSARLSASILHECRFRGRLLNFSVRFEDDEQSMQPTARSVR